MANETATRTRQKRGNAAQSTASSKNRQDSGTKTLSCEGERPPPCRKSHCKGRSYHRNEPISPNGKSRSAKLAHNAPLRLAHEATFAPKIGRFSTDDPSTKNTVRKMDFTSKITSIAAEGMPNDQTQRLRLIPQNKRQPLRLGYSTYRGVRIIKPPRRLLLRFQVEERLAPTHRRRSTASAALLSPSLR